MRHVLALVGAVMLGGCFAEPPADGGSSGSNGNSSGGATGSTGPASSTSISGPGSTTTTSTTVAETSTGTTVPPTTGTTTSFDSSDVSSTTGPSADLIIFDYHDVLCSKMVRRLTFSPSLGFDNPSCGMSVQGVFAVDRDAGPIDLEATTDAENVVFLTAPGSPTDDYQSQTSISTSFAQPIGGGGLRLRYRVDCRSDDVGTTQFGSIVSNGAGMNNAPVTEGTHTCGDPPTIVDEPLPPGDDRMVSIRVDGPQGEPFTLAIIDPVIYDPG